MELQRVEYEEEELKMIKQVTKQNKIKIKN